MKFSWNILSAFIRGVYTGEFANSILGKTRREEIDRSMKSEGKSQLATLFSLDANECYPLLVEKGIQFAFIPLFFAILVATFIWAAKERSTASLLAAALVIYKLVVVGITQYEPRHMNAVYLLALGCALRYFSERRSVRVRTDLS